MSSLRNGMAGLFALAMGCAVAAPALAAADAFLKLEGVEGEARAPDHKGEIEVLSWSFGASQTSSSPRFGAPAGRAAAGSQEPPRGPGAVTVTKGYDAASPELMRACATGKHIKSATLTVRKAGGGQQEYMTYELENVMVSSYSLSHGGSGGDRPMESLSLNFTKIEMKAPAAESGAAAKPPKAGYDVAPAKKI
jgi:type VI secretion system secreted protein Hcp